MHINLLRTRSDHVIMVRQLPRPTLYQSKWCECDSELWSYHVVIVVSRRRCSPGLERRESIDARERSVIVSVSSVHLRIAVGRTVWIHSLETVHLVPAPQLWVPHVAQLATTPKVAFSFTLVCLQVSAHTCTLTAHSGVVVRSCTLFHSVTVIANSSPFTR